MSLNISQSIILNILSSFQRGSLRVILADGTTRMFGDPNAAPNETVELRIVRPRFFRRVLLNGEIGFGEAYMDGDFEASDVVDLIRFFLANVETTPGLSGSRARPLAYNLLSGFNRLRHVMRRNTRSNSRRNIRDHYDLSNDFYSLWLDHSLTYSSAFFERPDEPLERAQLNKYRRLCEKVGLQPGMRILEIGCGWGGFALFAAREFGVHVTALTISREQFERARQRVTEAGLDDRVDIRFCDYRDIQGKFDAIVSIEMLEAVGHGFLETFFAQCHRLLAPTGVLALQVITCPDSRYEQSRKNADWIKMHIFPGGQLPSLTAISTALNRTGDLTLQHLENFGLHYARTLRAWRDAFNARIDDVRRLGFDDIFVRKWNFYLAYCEAAFASRNINVAQMVFARPNNTCFALPGERL